jgi:hypothetical protein
MTPTVAPAAPADDPRLAWRTRLDLVVRMLELAQRPSELQRLYLSVALSAARDLRDGGAAPLDGDHEYRRSADH